MLYLRQRAADGEKGMVRVRKNSLVMTALLLCVFIVTACGGNTDRGGNLYLRMDEINEEYKAEDGTVLLTVTGNLPVVTITGNETVAKTINEYLQKYDLQGISVAESEQWAEADYKERGKDNWHTYGIDTTFTGQRLDEKVISFSVLAYSYMGGAHPNAVSTGLNFRTETGERLTLADVTKDEQEARAEIEAYILEETKKMAAENEGMFFENYEESLKDILTEDTWYLAEDGFHIIGNEYIISPHAAGILSFVIPYEKADFLKEEFR